MELGNGITTHLSHGSPVKPPRSPFSVIKSMVGLHTGGTVCCTSRLHPWCLNKYQETSVALIVLMDTGGPGNWLDWWSSMLISCKCAARPVPCSLAWQVSAWAQPAGWHTGGTVQAAEMKLQCFPFPSPYTVCQLCQRRLFSHKLHSKSCNPHPVSCNKTTFLWAAAQLYICSGSTGWEGKKPQTFLH